MLLDTFLTEEIEGLVNQMSRPILTSLSKEIYTFPPYNIKIHDEEGNHCSLEIAVAGIPEENLQVAIEKNVLIVSHSKKENEDHVQKLPKYLHKGIAARTFIKRFVLGETTEVESATLQNGILTIELKSVVPENQKPKLITINSQNTEKRQLLNEH